MSEKILCIGAYLFSFPGAIIARLAGKDSPLCLHHARRSMELFLFMLFLPILWAAVMIVMMIIPFAFSLGIALYGIVVAAGIFCTVLSVKGIACALMGKTIIFPLVTSLMRRAEPIFVLLKFSEK